MSTGGTVQTAPGVMATIKESFDNAVKTLKGLDFIVLGRSGLMGTIMIFCIVGITGPLFSLTNESLFPSISYNMPASQKSSVYFDRYEVTEYNSKGDSYISEMRGTTCYRNSAHCNKDTDSLLASYCFAVLSCILACFAFLVIVSRLFGDYVPALTSAVLAGMLFVCLLISWAIGVALYSNVPKCAGSIDDSCSQNPFCASGLAPANFQPIPFHIDYGLALLITAWCLSLISVGVEGACGMGIIGSGGAANNGSATTSEMGKPFLATPTPMSTPTPTAANKM